MKWMKLIQKPVAYAVMIAFGLLSFFVAPINAGMVSTADILQSQEVAMARDKVQAFMMRQDVTHQIAAWGVAPEAARMRVAALTDEEVLYLSARIDAVPAGGDALSTIIAVSLIGFITLIVTDLLGYTDVFTFIKKR